MESQKLEVNSQNSKYRVDLKEICYNFSLKIIRLIDSLEAKRIHFSILDQLLRSSTSIGANIIEAKSASSKKDFVNFYQIALKSANETMYWLCLIRDGFKVDKTILEPIIQELTEITNIVAASVLKMKGKR